MTKYCVLLVLLAVFTPLYSGAVSLTSAEVKLANDISLYLDQKPDEHALKFCEYAINSESVVLRGLAVTILNKHFGDPYRAAFLKSYTLNPKNDNFVCDKKVTVKIENLKKLLEPYENMLKQIEDVRVRNLFLFYHFRHKNVLVLGEAREELSLALFYRLAFLTEVFEDETYVKQLVQEADR
ncbi:MAG: hypothetical protein PHF29_00350 [Candidatus Riflebacteria bacterium]|nr:hypothetical protein [Candidatus Riflebacteria bacterium]